MIKYPQSELGEIIVFSSNNSSLEAWKTILHSFNGIYKKKNHQNKPNQSSFFTSEKFIQNAPT